MKNIICLLFVLILSVNAQQKDSRMKWWRDARLGMFIHWGLYSIPAGEWKGNTNHAEWIRHTAQIPLEEYDEFVKQFNPVKFNAEEWVRTAKNAGMKYIVITSKHHDGFCLFHSKLTDFKITSTPFKRDVLKELAAACRKVGMKLCFYYSIMDWHHPDYLPRRSWEVNRSKEGADFSRYIVYLKSQLKELVTNYGDIGVLWFDGEWEDTWTKELGDDLYNYVRSLDKHIIINNRVSKGRSGMETVTNENHSAGDFGTPEQTVPPTGLPGVDWESCITMNDNWGYNKHDNNFKPVRYLLQMISDIASKGGNLLLNVGPTSEGIFPQQSIDRMAEIGKWMKKNGEAIYKTGAGPFSDLQWGRCTQKRMKNGTRLYLHVFDWPKDGKLFVPGIANKPKRALLFSDGKKLAAKREEDGIIISLPAKAPDENVSVVVLDIYGKPEVTKSPSIETGPGIFADRHEVKINSEYKNFEIRYTLDGSTPSASSPLYASPVEILNSTLISARIFSKGKPLSPAVKAEFRKVEAAPPVIPDNPQAGIYFKYYEGDWNVLPDFSSLKSVGEGVLPDFTIAPAKRNEKFGFEFDGLINVPKDGVYVFYLESDDGSRMFIGDKMLIDNDNLHGMILRQGAIALKAGFHPLRLTYFNASGEKGLKISYQIPGKEKEVIPDSVLFH